MTSRCESCMYYDYDEDYDVYTCELDLDQDDMENFLTAHTAECPYYRFYNEYISVRRQN